MDETSLFSNMPGNSTVRFKMAYTVSMRTNGHEKQHFTVVLACLADGTKLKPMIVFKQKNIRVREIPEWNDC